MSQTTVTEFREIIKKAAGEHPMDKYIRWENLPSPWVGDLDDFGLRRQTKGVKGKSLHSSYRQTQIKKSFADGKAPLPKVWLPHGSQADKERYERVFTDEVLLERLGNDMQDNDVIPYLDFSQKYFKDNWDVDKYKSLYTLNDAVRKSVVKAIEKGYGAKGQGKKVRALRHLGFYDNEAVQIYLDQVKAIQKLAIAKDTIFMGIPQSERSEIQPVAGAYYSAISGMWNKFKSIRPRPLLGTSEKVEKSDGTKVEVKVMYLAPSKRSDNLFPDEYLRYGQIPIAMDELSTKQGLFPNAPDFSKIDKYGAKLQRQYNQAKELYKSSGFVLYKNNPKKMKMCRNPNTCPYAGACAGLCLIDSGRMESNIEPATAGYMKTWYFFLYPLFFLRQLLNEVKNGSKKAVNNKITFFARLNGTSDIPWERYIDMDLFTADMNEQYGKADLEAFGGFYDYNKYSYDFRKEAGDWIDGECPESYDLTYSISEAIVAKGANCAVFPTSPFSEAIEDALQWIDEGFRVATVVEYWKFLPRRDFMRNEKLALKKAPKIVKAAEEGRLNVSIGEYLHAEELLYYENRNKRAGEDLDITIIEFNKKRVGGEYQFDENGRFDIVTRGRQVSVPDFNVLGRTAINSLDESNRARNILIIDGDETDFRFNDPKPSIVILKPKGLWVTPKGNKSIYDRDGKLLKAGDIYVSVPTNTEAGGRYNKKVTASGQQFIMRMNTVLQLQRLFLSQMTDQQYQAMYPQTMLAIDLKGPFVYEKNIKESLPDDQKENVVIAAEKYGIKVLNFDPRKKIAVEDIYEIKNPNTPSEIEAFYDSDMGIYYLASEGKVVEFKGTQTWSSSKSLLKDLGKEGFTVVDGYVVEK